MTEVQRSRSLAPPPLPNSRQELEAQRRVRRTITLNDMYEMVYKVLNDIEGVEEIRDESARDKARDQRTKFRSFILAVYDSQAVEGSLTVDNIKAAEMVRDYARSSEIPEIAELRGLNLATLVKVQGVVLRRYGQDRKSRRLMLGGEVVSNGDEE